jgi:hypothetical protein
MAWRFRRSVRLLPGIRLYLGKRGASVSLGGRGLTHTIGSRGSRTTIGLPGTGLSYSHKHAPGAASPGRLPIGGLVAIAVVALVLIAIFSS